MAEVLLTFLCAPQDSAVITAAIRAHVQSPIQVRDEMVRGWDYGDASTAELVSGLLRRTAIEIVVEQSAVPILVENVDAARRELPVRWHATPVLAGGRLA